MGPAASAAIPALIDAACVDEIRDRKPPLDALKKILTGVRE